jgi:hypothetical protein
MGWSWNSRDGGKGFLEETGFVSGHGFSRAADGEKKMGFSPCGTGSRPRNLLAENYPFPAKIEIEAWLLLQLCLFCLGQVA